VKDEFIEGQYRSIINIISDTENNVYQIKNKALLLKFNASELLSTIESGKSYQVQGYGLRIPFLNLYPNIIEVV
tara:strand:+ start:22341 stop:22562 length:222 start_codon:yes stop_codon:yes gene_type:complete